jgi:quinol monooxygenase YgiN
MNIIRITMNGFPEKRKEVLQTLLSFIKPIGKEKGCLSYYILKELKSSIP